MLQNVSYFPLPQTSTSLSHTIYGPSSLDPDQRPEFGTCIEWNYNADLLAVGSPHYGATDEGVIFVYNANQELVWSLLGSAKERIGGRISISNNYIAVGRRSAIEIYDTNTGDVISQVLGTMPGNDVNFVKNNLIIVGEDPFGTRQGQARIFTANGFDWTAQTVSGLMLPEVGLAGSLLPATMGLVLPSLHPMLLQIFPSKAMFKSWNAILTVAGNSSVISCSVLRRMGSLVFPSP